MNIKKEQTESNGRIPPHIVLLRALKKKEKKEAALHRPITFDRKWAMPNKETFRIKPIKELIEKYVKDGKVWVDPFVRNSIFKPRMTFTNDLNTEFLATHHMDALDFLKTLKDNSCDGVLFDPPYSVRQVAECYNSVGKKTTMSDTQSTFYTFLKAEITRITKKGAVVVSFGWNSGGIGKTLGFCIDEILLVPHGGPHNDTIVTVEHKL